MLQGITGFLSAYFMETQEFRVQRHFEELETGMHVLVCDDPPNMKVFALLKRLQVDIPPCQCKQVERARMALETSQLVPVCRFPSLQGNDTSVTRLADTVRFLSLETTLLAR